MQYVDDALEAVAVIKSEDRVFIHTGAAVPTVLVQAMTERANELHHVELVHLHTEGDAPYCRPEYRENFHTNNLFVGSNVRAAIDQGLADYIPVFLSEIPALFRRRILPIDVALIHVSPPDRHGFCSLGVSADITCAAIQTAHIVIAQINPQMPRTHGDGLIHIDNIKYGINVDLPLPEISPNSTSEVSQAIGSNCAELIEDGATLQLGIGAIPDAVLAALTNHRDLGIHTEMFSDGIIDLVAQGVINGRKKKIHPGKLVTSFAVGTRRLYDFIDDNPTTLFLDVGYVNDTAVIRRNPQVTAINSAIEVDFTGQICADSIGTYQYSGVGGQMDFIRGASLSEGGKPIIALPATTSRGESRIVPYLKPGAGVVTTRAHAHYIVTEYGVANLYGKNLRQRAQALIDIAHPEHRAHLTEEAYKRFKLWAH